VSGTDRRVGGAPGSGRRDASPGAAAASGRCLPAHASAPCRSSTARADREIRARRGRGLLPPTVLEQGEEISQVPVAEGVRGRPGGRRRKRTLLRSLRRAGADRRPSVAQPRSDQIGVRALELARPHRYPSVREAVVPIAGRGIVTHGRTTRRGGSSLEAASPFPLTARASAPEAVPGRDSARRGPRSERGEARPRVSSRPLRRPRALDGTVRPNPWRSRSRGPPGAGV
jgi:hypothetical protein